jgi:radical SAM superfamily enzyme YgiQ (UPF0313 family)
MEKVLLLQPPVSFKEKAFALVPNCPHLGLLYLAAALIKQGLEPKYLDVSDNSLGLEDLLKIINSESIKVVGITTMTQNIKGAVQLARFLKESKCAAKIIVGGPHISADPKLWERFPYFDVAVTGESEITFPQIVQDLIRGKSIKGIVKGETPMNLDDLPFPARHIVDHSIYKKRGVWANGIFATRGCPYHCNFCSIPAIDKRVRFRSPGLIVEVRFFDKDEIFQFQRRRPDHQKRICYGTLRKNIEIAVSYQMGGSIPHQLCRQRHAQDNEKGRLYKIAIWY